MGIIRFIDWSRPVDRAIRAFSSEMHSSNSYFVIMFELAGRSVLSFANSLFNPTVYNSRTTNVFLIYILSIE